MNRIIKGKCTCLNAFNPYERGFLEYKRGGQLYVDATVDASITFAGVQRPCEDQMLIFGNHLLFSCAGGQTFYNKSEYFFFVIG